MDYLITLLILIIVGLGVWWLTKGKENGGGNAVVSGGVIGVEVEKARQNKEKVLEFLAGAERVTNNDVEKLLGVSNATAERYLNELEQNGRLKQVGEVGRGVYYVKI